MIENNCEKKQRNLNIDFLRGIGIIMVILGHCQLPQWFHEIKCFIVPLLVFCSGLTCKGKKYGNYLSFIWKRVKRILIPCYLFTLFFYALYYFEEYLTNRTLQFDSADFINAFLLRNDSMMGYLWVMKVFLLIMFATPLLVKLADRIQSFKVLIIVLLVMIVIHQGLFYLCDYIPIRIIRLIYREYFLYLTGYASLFVLGVKMGKVDKYGKNALLISTILLLLVFVSYVGIYRLPFHLLSQRFKISPSVLVYYVWSCLECFFMDSFEKTKNGRKNCTIFYLGWSKYNVVFFVAYYMLTHWMGVGKSLGDTVCCGFIKHSNNSSYPIQNSK